MSGGFALVAYPVKYAVSGVMTFMVGQDGVVYEQDLGPDTVTLAASLVEYNPDESWTAVPVALTREPPIRYETLISPITVRRGAAGAVSRPRR